MKKILVGIITGFISGLFSAGGGLLLIQAYTNIFKLNEKQARATSLFTVLLMTIVTAIIYNKNNFIYWPLGIKCAIGGIFGGLIGGILLNKIPKKFLQISFVLFLFYAGINSIMR